MTRGAGASMLGLSDIALLLGVAPGTPQKWRTRGLLPEPDGMVSGRPVWTRERIVAWAEQRRRAPR